MQGIIIKNISNSYKVRSTKGLYNCQARGKFKHDQTNLLVGDKVIFDDLNLIITKVLPRINYLIRPSIANVDQALIITSVKNPNFSSYLLDKLLTIISFNNIIPIICFTKLDLLNKEELKEIKKYQDYYERLGFMVLKNTDKQTLKQVFKNKVSVLTGQSGAGKSTLLNNLNKELNLNTNEISMSLGRGKHTTRHVELYEIYEGYVADTPGFSAVDFIGMSKNDIRDNMPDMFEYLQHCKYRDCLHLQEDGCYVKKMLEQDDDEILKVRYENYLKFINKEEKKYD